MKKIIFFYCLFFTNVLLSQNLSADVVYVLASNNKKITKSDETKVFKDIEFKLVCNSSVSRFEQIQKMESNASRSNERFILHAKAKGVFYKNLITKENLHALSFINKKYMFLTL